MALASHLGLSPHNGLQSPRDCHTAPCCLCTVPHTLPHMDPLPRRHTPVSGPLHLPFSLHRMLLPAPPRPTDGIPLPLSHLIQMSLAMLSKPTGSFTPSLSHKHTHTFHYTSYGIFPKSSNYHLIYPAICLFPV